MSAKNGNGAHHQGEEVSLGHVEISDVFLAGLVALLQVSDTRKLSGLEREALAFSAKVLGDAMNAMDARTAHRWRERLVATVIEADETDKT